MLTSGSELSKASFSIAAPTAAEVKVLRAMAVHGTIRAAAEDLFLSAYTVKAHLEHLRIKTGLHTTSQLIAWAAQLGLLSDDSETGARRESS